MSNENIFTATCGGCGERVLIWPASPSAICHRCEQQLANMPHREEDQEELGQWIGGLI